MSQTDKDIWSEAKHRFARCQSWESQARANALNDAKFANGDSYNNWQWPDSIRSVRQDRPCLTQNKVRQHNLHIINDARQHKAAIKVTPVGGHASYEAAQIFAAIIRRIVYQSKAIDAYSTAIYHQVESGMGYVRVITDYVDERSFDQEIYIKRVKDPRAVYMDPDAQEYDKADARFAFVFEDKPREWDDPAPPSAALDDMDGWETDDHVREAEYWRKGERDEPLYLLDDGSSVMKSELPPGAIKGKMIMFPPGSDVPVRMIVRERMVAVPEIEWFRLRGDKIVERKVWPGKYIPIVPCIGEETVINGQMDRKGHTRALIDAQRMYNYWNSAAVEQVALQTKAPFIAPVRAVEGLETYWNGANTVNHPYLPYNDVDDEGRDIAAPTRAMPPTMAQAYLAGMQTAKEDMMLVSGQYQAEMGAPGNERSGVAIQQRQREGDTATYHFIDNQAKMIRQVGRICLDLIPHIYDVARVVQIMAEDGATDEIEVDPTAMQAHQQIVRQPGGQMVPVDPAQADKMKEDPNAPNPMVIFNPNVGRYDVESDVGPAWGTKREEAVNALTQIIQAAPNLMMVAGDILAENMDWPGADALAERLKRGVPPQFLGGPSQKEQELQGQLQQTQQLAQKTLQQADAEIATLKGQIAELDARREDMRHDNRIDDYKAETERLKAVSAADPMAGKVLVRSMLSDLLQMPAMPIMHEHERADAQLQQEIAPPEPPTEGPPQ